MRVGVIGAGAIGGTIAALLARAGHTVEVTARGAQLGAIAADGISLSGAWGDFTARVQASELLTKSPDLAFLTVKAQDATSAIRANSAMLRGIPLVVVQNGLESVAGARAAAPKSDVIGGLAMYAASFLSLGSVSITTPGVTWLGGELLPTLYASRILGEVMPVKVTDNFEGAQWTKLIVNHVNALPAIVGESVQSVIADHALRLIMTESMREAIRVARARGIVFESMQGLSSGRLGLIATLPLGVAQLLPRLMSRRMGKTPNPGSTQQSIRRGQLTEIDYLNGAVVAAGLVTQVPTPVSAAIVELVHEVEKAGAFLPRDEVVRRIALR